MRLKLWPLLSTWLSSVEHAEVLCALRIHATMMPGHMAFGKYSLSSITLTVTSSSWRRTWADCVGVCISLCGKADEIPTIEFLTAFPDQFRLAITQCNFDTFRFVWLYYWTDTHHIRLGDRSTRRWPGTSFSSALWDWMGNYTCSQPGHWNAWKYSVPVHSSTFSVFRSPLLKQQSNNKTNSSIFGVYVGK